MFSDKFGITVYTIKEINEFKAALCRCTLQPYRVFVDPINSNRIVDG